jgi:arsenate reductase (thioredoxin)
MRSRTCAFISFTASALLVCLIGIAAIQQATFAQLASTPEEAPAAVVFICEHGAAKSVVAAAWFNKLAAERQLPFRAVARGFTPQEQLSESAVAGLQRDHVPFTQARPQLATAIEASHALRVVAFDPPPASAQTLHAVFFAVPAPKDGYNRSREAIVERVRALLDDLQRQAPAR